VPRPPDERRRRELLDALVEAFGAGGIGGRSLREVAAAVGTSHRMLLHHFDSRDELLLAIVEEVERRQQGALDELPDDPAAAFTAMWDGLRQPELRPFERLFFECYARGAQGEEPFARLVPAAVDAWLAEVAARAPDMADPALARLGLAVTRGLLLDLVATNDDAGVDAAAQRFAELLGSGREGQQARPHRRAGAQLAADGEGAVVGEPTGDAALEPG
jgi:AcrR family transcriptional regulator